MMFEKLIEMLRGEKIEYYLIEGETKLINPQYYPHKKDEIPIICENIEKLSLDKGYISGFRSVIKLYRDYIVKLKGIGIPFKDVKPIYKDKTIYTYFFTKEYIGTGQLMWGFMTREEAENELEKMLTLKDLGIPMPEPIGLGFYDNIKLLEIPNRYELANKLMGEGKEKLLNMLEKACKSSQGACIIYKNVSDVRVDEILYGLLIPKIDKILDVKDVKAYLKWLGSSCGYNLRILHNNGIIHGTIMDPTRMGIYTNSHLANHVVGFNETYITDFHLTRKLSGKEFDRMRMEEYYALWHVMNPLPSAEKFIMSQFRRTTLLNTPEMLSQMHTPESFQTFDEVISMHSGIYRPIDIYEEFTESWIDGIEYGYNRLKKYEIEAEKKRDMLIKLSALKEIFLELYGLPKGMERGREIVDIIMKMRKIDEKDLPKKVKEKINKILELF